MRADKCDNEYAHPLDLCALVDLNLGKVRSWAGTRTGGMWLDQGLLLLWRQQQYVEGLAHSIGR